MNTQYQEEISPISQFLSPKTVEEQFVLQKFNPDMIEEVRKLSPFFTEDDTENILSCKTPKECLYTVASIISRIRSENLIDNHKPDPKNLLHTETVRQRLGEILLKKQ